MCLKDKPQTVNRYLLRTKSLFTVSLAVAIVTILGIWLLDVGQHRTLFENSILTTSILSVAFFLFIAVGLFRGTKLKDDIGKLTDNIKYSDIPDISGISPSVDFIDMGDDFGAIILGIFSWLVALVLAVVILWAFGAILWTGILIFIAILYWIFFRALRLVFKNSNKCKGDFLKSVAYGLGYTTVYNFWIYGIILGTHYLLN